MIMPKVKKQRKFRSSLNKILTTKRTKKAQSTKNLRDLREKLSDLRG